VRLLRAQQRSRLALVASLPRGPSRIFVGIPYFEIPNLLAIGFNNTASSVLVD
jgi:hypothetical protein